ncbi:hypothetical protein VHEMI09358 [[Torrubiella] hemipterigena]|uniref:Aminotransferase class I/classII large domain-containing protein n=1 Tax=[Torrubiella] hemipterigena TaxID=1531966 RepID=A0A0A1TG67_9HYPO|nr:hypothetical protein VHEMI09358 [[Torrubiella] hemipterigena]
MSLSKRASALTNPNPVLAALANLWDAKTNPDGYLSLGVAENTLQHELLSKHIHKNLAVPNEAFTYGDGCKDLGDSMARFLNRKLNPVKPLERSHIVITNGCTVGIEHAAWLFTDPGEAILLGRPYYTAFLDDATLRTGSKIAEVSFKGTDALGPGCVERYEKEIDNIEARGERVGALILCNPHNPLGRCYARDVVVEIMKLCQRRKLHLISDEIYACSIWDNVVDTEPAPEPFVSVLAIDPTDIIDPERVHVLWGMSKDFGANGIRMGALISQHNQEVHQRLQPLGLFGSTSSLADHVTTNILNDDAWVDDYLASNSRALSDSYAYVTSWAKKHHIPYAPGANAGFFVWLDFGAAYVKHHPEAQNADLDQVIMDALLKNRVFLAAGFRFGAEEAGWYRIVFSHERAYLDEGLRRIIQALEGPSMDRLTIA